MIVVSHAGQGSRPKDRGPRIEAMKETLTQAAADAWIARWDAQQQAFLPDREERFTALIDAVQECAGRDDPLVLDLGCGPGSLAVRLLDRIPAASVIAIDTDPLLLGLGRAAWSGRSWADSGSGRLGSLRFADLDLRVRGWTGGARAGGAGGAGGHARGVDLVAADAPGRRCARGAERAS